MYVAGDVPTFKYVAVLEYYTDVPGLPPDVVGLHFESNGIGVPHGYSEGDTIKVYGATESIYNYLGPISVYNTYYVYWAIGSAPVASPATGDIVVIDVVPEPRYSLDGQFVERVEAEAALNQLLSAGNASLIEINGLVSVTWDYKLDTSAINASPIYTNQNVNDGLFEYSSSHVAENYTQVNVTIQDKTNLNRTKTIVVSSDELAEYLYGIDPTKYNYCSDSQFFVQKYGYNTLDVVLQGVNSDATAIRKARSLLFDSLMNDEIVTFKNLAEAAVLHKGKVIRVMDEDNFTITASGRVVSYDWNNITEILTITLDREVDKSILDDVTLYRPDTPDYETVISDTEVATHAMPAILIPQEVGEAGFTNILTFHLVGYGISNPNLSVATDSIWVTKRENIQLYKVVSVMYEDDSFTVTAMKYQTLKFDYIDSLYITKQRRAAAINFEEVNAAVTFPTEAFNIDSADNFTQAEITYVVSFIHVPITDGTGVLARQTSYYVRVNFPTGIVRETTVTGLSPASDGKIYGQARVIAPRAFFGLSTDTEVVITVIASAVGTISSRPATKIYPVAAYSNNTYFAVTDGYFEGESP